VSITPGSQIVLHAKALPGNPYDRHVLGSIIDATEKLIGCAIERAYVDEGYRGHKTENPRRVFISGQKRDFGAIEREFWRRSAIEPIIGRMKSDGSAPGQLSRSDHRPITSGILGLTDILITGWLMYRKKSAATQSPRRSGRAQTCWASSRTSQREQLHRLLWSLPSGLFQMPPSFPSAVTRNPMRCTRSFCPQQFTSASGD
jgi:hypothetical protein